LRADFNKRQGGNWLSNLIQTAVDAIWAGAAYLGVTLGLGWMLVPAAVAVVVTALFRRPPSVYVY
jgi:hypothetical protein